MQPNASKSLQWAQILIALRACAGQNVRVRDGADFVLAGEIKPRQTGNGTAFGLLESETPVSRVALIERLEALSKDAPRFRGSATARVDDAQLLIESVLDETDEAGVVWATINTRRPKLGFNASQSTVRFPGGRSKMVKR